MTPANSRLTAILCCVFVGFSGCGQTDTPVPLTSDNDALLNELLGSTDADSDNETSDAEEIDSSDSVVKTVSSETEIQSTDADTSESIVDDILGSRDEDSPSITASLVTGRPTIPSVGSTNSPSSESIQLSVGDQFPFVKTIRQTVVQTSTNRASMQQTLLNAETQLQLTMNVSVQNQSATGFVCDVRYLRVQYYQNIDGQQQNYDSAVTQAGPVPSGLESYAGMVGNGFRFSLSGQNRIEGTEGLSTFLDQCVAAAPFDQRVSAKAALEQRFQSGAVPELLDESMGLLPYGPSRPQQGDIWMTNRNLQQQSSMALQTTCRLVSVTGTTAEVGLTGRFESSPADASLRISDGRTMGTCIVDLASGMPVHCHRSTYLKVASEQPTELIEITKRIESTFTSQNESARLLVQQHGATATSFGQTEMGIAPSPAPYQMETRSAALPQGTSTNQPAGSAFHGGAGMNGFGSGATRQGFPVQPVSSSNQVGGSTTAAPLQIPGGVSADELQSTTEAVYPD